MVWIVVMWDPYFIVKSLSVDELSFFRGNISYHIGEMVVNEQIAPHMTLSISL